MDLWSFLLLFFIGQGIFLLFLIAVRKNKAAAWTTFFLSSMIFLLLWYLIEFFLIRHTIKLPLDQLYGTRYGSWLFIGPCYFFYVLSLTSELTFKKNYLFHFFPAIIMVILLPLLSGDTLSHRQIHYGMLSVFDHRPKSVTWYEYFYSTAFYFQFIHLGIYLFISWLTIRKYQASLKDWYSESSKVFWLYLFTGLMFLALILAGLFVGLLFHSHVYERYMDHLYIFPFGLILYSLGLYLSGVEWPKLPIHKGAEGLSVVNNHFDYTAKSHELLEVIESNKLYLDAQLRLPQLAREISLSTHQLSHLLNHHFQTTFYDFINKYRVDHVKEAIENKKKGTLLQLAFAAGFNNKTSFVNAFKKYEKCTPSAYRKNRG